MIAQIEGMKLKERREMEEKRRAAREMQETLAKANLEQTKFKQRVADAEREDEKRIANCIFYSIFFFFFYINNFYFIFSCTLYSHDSYLIIKKDLKEKSEREAAYAQEQARIKQQKEKEWATLRAAQQREVDRRGEVDLLRAQAEHERLEQQAKDREL